MREHVLEPTASHLMNLDKYGLLGTRSGRTLLLSYHVCLHSLSQAICPPQSHTAPHTPRASCYSNFAYQERCQIAIPKNSISNLKSFYFEAHNKPRLLKEIRNIHNTSSNQSKGRTITNQRAAELGFRLRPALLCRLFFPQCHGRLWSAALTHTEV